MEQIPIRTQKHTQFLRIDDEIQAVIARAAVRNGICHLFVPHTTAGITINENADPDVVRDITESLENLVPWDNVYAHCEGNSAAHIKASMMGFSQTVFVKDGKLALGRWQSIYFCEFDGPRDREIWVQVVPDSVFEKSK